MHMNLYIYFKYIFYLYVLFVIEVKRVYECASSKL